MNLLKKIGNYIWSRQFLINIGAIALVYVIGVIIFNSCLKSQTNHGVKIEVPNLIGKNQNNLDNLLSGTELKYEVLDSIYKPTEIEGTILEQDPAPSSLSDVYVKPGRTIKVRVSKRTQLVEMPGLIDKSQRFAEMILVSRGFRYKLEYKPSKEADGAVLEQLYKNKPIQHGTKIPIGSKVVLVVGRDEGGEPVVLPNLYGLTIVEAKERVAAVGGLEFHSVCNECVTKADSMVARVYSQSPEFSEGELIAPGSTITVIARKE